VFNFIAKNIGIPSRKLTSITLISSGTLAWYFFLEHVSFETIFLNFTTNPSSLYYGSSLLYLFSALSSIIGSILSQKINQRQMLWAWITFGVLTTSALLFVQGEAFIFIFGPLLGISLGLGFPYALTLMAENTTIDQRGRVSGIILVQTFMMIAVATFIEAVTDSWVFSILLLVVIRSTSYLTLILNKGKTRNEYSDTQKAKSWFSIITYKNFVMYFFPWLMFIIAIVLTDHIVWPTLPKTADYDMAFAIGDPLHYLGTAIFAIVSGIWTDRYGRKVPIMIGLVMLGISFAIMGMSISPLSVFIHLMAIGIGFGFLMVTYMAVPGDLAFPYSKERFYALILVIPLTVYGGLGAIPRALGITASANLLSPILSIILLTSGLPVLFAQETLPKSKLDEMRMRDHIKKVGELFNKLSSENDEE
jgi:MFS family permease